MDYFLVNIKEKVQKQGFIIGDFYFIKYIQRKLLFNPYFYNNPAQNTYNKKKYSILIILRRREERRTKYLLIQNMENEYRYRFIHRTALLFVIFIMIFGGKPVIKVSASSVPGFPTSIEAITFDDHKGMFSRINVNGQWHYIYCIQRGYPFRSAVSELQMVKATTYNMGFEHYGTIASNIRDLFVNYTDPSKIRYFRGWAQWEMNSDHTDAYQVGTDGAPSSSAWFGYSCP